MLPNGSTCVDWTMIWSENKQKWNSETVIVGVLGTLRHTKDASTQTSKKSSTNPKHVSF